ncbi:MAG: hypothetical protein FWG99_07665 [Treponema sp.]|nr:hypothetical protein [Treponema sp.]
MKKMGFVCFVFSLLSCTTSAKIVYDDTVPLESTSWLSLYNVGTVIAYNGMGVNWKLGATKMLQIPAGDTILEVDLNSMRRGTTYGDNIMLFAYVFEPQKQYFFELNRSMSTRGLNIYKYDFGEKIPVSYKKHKEHYFEFVPFLNAPGRIILN